MQISILELALGIFFGGIAKDLVNVFINWHFTAKAMEKARQAYAQSNHSPHGQP